MAVASVPQLTVLSRSDGEDVAYTTDGTVKVNLRRVHVKETNARPEFKDLWVLFDPTTRAYTWEYTNSREVLSDPSNNFVWFKKQHKAFLRNGTLVDFWMKLFEVCIYDNNGFASNLDDAETRSLSAVSRSIEAGDFLFGNNGDMRVVQLKSLNYIGNDFLSPPMSSIPTVLPDILKVQWDEDKKHWILKIKGRWNAEAILDEDYKLVSTRRLPDDPQK